MKLKKYNEYVKEELTPMAGELEVTDLEMPEVSDMDSELDTELNSEEPSEMDVVSSEEEEEGNDVHPDVNAWKGDQLLQQFAEIMGTEIVDNQVVVNDDIVTFAPETNTFLIAKAGEDSKRKNTKISDPHELVHKEFKGHDHKH
jgi:hypothetical protein